LGIRRQEPHQAIENAGVKRKKRVDWGEVSLHIQQAVEDGILILRVDGELDLETAPALKKAVERGLLGAQVHNLVLNLSGVSFIDSSGIGVLLGRYKELSQVGGQVVLASLEPQVETVLELSGLGRVIPFAESEEEALRLIARGRRHNHA